MLNKIFAVAGGCAVAIALTGCEATKSSNPLAPTVAGPIPGVNITMPAAVDPSTGAKIPVDKQPITLTVVNASTNGVRPLSYVFDVATDADFTNKVFSRDGVAPGDGRTSLRLPDSLATGRSYYWRARAQDGANTGPFTRADQLQRFHADRHPRPGPRLAASERGGRQPPADVCRDQRRRGLDQSGRSAIKSRSATTTTFGNSHRGLDGGRAAEPDVAASRRSTSRLRSVYFWHARAFDPTTTGPWSPAHCRSRRRPEAGAGGGGPAPVVSGPAPGDAINLNLASVYNSPSDIASWPATCDDHVADDVEFAPASHSISRHREQLAGCHPAGIQRAAAVHGLGGRERQRIVEHIGIHPDVARPRAARARRSSPTSPINWAYDARWGPMAHYQPHAGEQMGFFLSAGNARGESGVSSVKERTNVVLVSLPAGDSGVFSFSSAFMPFRR